MIGPAQERLKRMSQVTNPHRTTSSEAPSDQRNPRKTIEKPFCPFRAHFSPPRDLNRWWRRDFALADSSQTCTLSCVLPFFVCFLDTIHSSTHMGHAGGAGERAPCIFSMYNPVARRMGMRGIARVSISRLMMRASNVRRMRISAVPIRATKKKVLTLYSTFVRLSFETKPYV